MFLSISFPFQIMSFLYSFTFPPYYRPASESASSSRASRNSPPLSGSEVNGRGRPISVRGERGEESCSISSNYSSTSSNALCRRQSSRLRNYMNRSTLHQCRELPEGYGKHTSPFFCFGLLFFSTGGTNRQSSLTCDTMKDWSNYKWQHYLPTEEQYSFGITLVNING